MSTLKSVLLNIALIFAGIYVPAIKDPLLQKAAAGSLVVVAAAAAKKNSETDQSGNPLPTTQK